MTNIVVGAGNMIFSPLAVSVSRNKKFILNINNYRNAHHITLNKAKVNYADAVAEQVESLLGWNRVSVRFTLFPGTRRRTDVTNVCSIHDKFLLDALVKAGKLPDDDYKHLDHVSYRFGSVDPGNGRVEVEFIDEDF